MQLLDYIRSTGKTVAAWGREAGIPSRVRMHRLVHGHRFPTPIEINLIRAASNGAVTADDFVNQHTASASEAA